MSESERAFESRFGAWALRFTTILVTVSLVLFLLIELRGRAFNGTELSEIAHFWFMPRIAAVLAIGFLILTYSRETRPGWLTSLCLIASTVSALVLLPFVAQF